MKKFLVSVLAVLVASPLIADDEAGKKLLKSVEGVYSVSSLSRAGTMAPDEFTKGLSFEFKGDKLTAKFGDGKDKVATVVIGTTATPNTIDLTPTEGEDAGKPLLGIIKVEKDQITMCFADAPKADRPKEFKADKESRQMLIVMKKK